MRINKKIAAFCLLALLALLALLFLALPPLARHIAIGKIDQATGRKSEIAKFSFNPLTLRAEITGFRLTEKGSGATFVSFSSARLSLSPLSLPRRSFIVRELHLASPYLHVVRTAPNSFNFSDLVTGRKGEKKKAEGGTPLYSVNNITIANGSIDFQDRAVAGEKRHTVRGLSLSVPFFSNMPYLADRYVTPHLSAVVNGSPVRFDGRLKPLSKAVEATIALNVRHIDLPFYLGYLPFPPPVELRSGKLDTSLEVGYRVDERRGPDLRLAGSVAVEQAAVRMPGGAPLAALDRGELRIRDASLLSRRFDLASLELEGMELFAARDRRGVWNFQKIAGFGKRPGAKPEAEHEHKPLSLELGRLSAKNGKLHLADAVPKGGVSTELRDIDLELENFSTRQGRKAPFSLRFDSARGESAALKGELGAAPLEAKGNLALKGIPLRDYYPYLSDLLTAPLSGTVGVSSDFRFDKRQGLVLERGALKGEDLAAPFGPGQGFRIKELLAKGVAVRLNQRKASVEGVELRGGNFALALEKGGTLSAQRLLRQKQVTAAAREKRPLPGQKPPPFFYRVEKVTGRDIGIRFTDRSREEEQTFVLDGMNFTLAGISGPEQGAVPFTLATGYGKKGRIAASGRVTPSPFKFNGRVELQRIPLRDFDPYINRDTAIFIADGALDAKLSVNVAKRPAGFTGEFGGSLGVRSFYCQDTVFNQDLLKWERLQLERVKGTLGPFSLAVGEVSLGNFYSRVIIEKDGTLNLQHLQAEGDEGSETAAATKRGTAARGGTRPSGAVAGQPASQPHPVRIDAVTLQGGTLAFSDRHMESPFDTTFYNLGGRVSGLSSQWNTLARVDLRGNLENHSPLSITGAINPLRGDLYLDLKIAFSDIELSPFTPYSGTYLGYNVDKGKLFLDLSYRIDKKSLSSQNKVFIDQFSFGKEVESAKATKLPVKLAVALLKDRKGEIHLDLPVAGRTDDPKFSVWRVVLQMLRNLVAKAATSPMALLGSMFAGKEDFSAVYFAPGSDRLSQGEKDKLSKLSQALADRPALNLELSGFVDREQDAEGYRNEMLVKKMKGEKFRALVKRGQIREGQSQEETEILPQEYPLYLKAVYKKEKFPKPRNALGFTKELPDAEMKKLILTHTVVGKEELQALARERVEAVKGFLVKEGKIPAGRLFEKSADIYLPPRKGGSSRVEFGASIK